MRRKIIGTNLLLCLFLIMFMGEAWAGNGTPIVKVESETINIDELLSLVRQHTNDDEALAALVIQQMSDRDQRELLRQITDMLVLADRAQRKGLYYNSDVAARLKWARLSILAEAYVSDASKHWDLSESALKTFYKTHPDLYTAEEAYHFRQILVGTASEARFILLQILTGRPFEKTAAETSLDFSTSKEGGDMGWMSKKELPDPFKDAVSMKPGELRGPIKTDYGYHILQLIEKKGGKLAPYEEVAEKVQKDLEDVYLEKEIKELSKNTEIMNNVDELKRIRIP